MKKVISILLLSTIFAVSSLAQQVPPTIPPAELNTTISEKYSSVDLAKSLAFKQEVKRLIKDFADKGNMASARNVYDYLISIDPDADVLKTDFFINKTWKRENRSLYRFARDGTGVLKDSGTVSNFSWSKNAGVIHIITSQGVHTYVRFVTKNIAAIGENPDLPQPKKLELN